MKKTLICLTLICAALLVIASPAQATGQALAAAPAEVGSSYDYTLVHRYELTNDSAFYARNITVSVPLPDNDAPPYCRLIGMELSPYPSEITTDADGHRFAVYNINYLRRSETFAITHKFALTTMDITYTIDTSASAVPLTDGETTALDTYLTQNNAVTAAVNPFVRECIKNETNPYRKARLLFGAINIALTYSDNDTPQDAVSVLQRRTANCEGYTNLYLACLRACGIAARQQSGYLYNLEQDDPPYQAGAGTILNSVRHTWVEFYLPAQGWVMADPTFTYIYEINGIQNKFIDWDYFAVTKTPRHYFYFRTGNTATDSIDINYTSTSELDVVFMALAQDGHNYLPFADISGHWAREPITACVEQGLFTGVSSSAFAPNMNMTRAMFVTLLGRLYQSIGGHITDYDSDDMAFTDITAEAYYLDYLNWAVNNHLISGYDETHFGPNDNITREQMATIIASFMVRLYNADEQLTLNSLAFADAELISHWARAGVDYCVQTGVISGFEDSTFRPADYATRAQVAALIQRVASLL